MARSPPCTRPTTRSRSHLRDVSVHGTLLFMNDTRGLILTTISACLAIVTIVVTVLSMQIAGVNTRIDDARADGCDLRAHHVRFEQRLDDVEVAYRKVEQRLETLERIFLPSREPADN